MPESAQSGVISVTLPDGSRREIPRGSTVRDLGFAIGERLGKATVGGRLDGAAEIVDLRTEIRDGQAVQIITADSEDGLEVIRHSAAHILADAVLRLWPSARLAIGPAIADGFYYDIDLEHRLTPDDLPLLEAEMAKIVAADSAFERCLVDREQEILRARNSGDIYKAELMEGFDPTSEVTFYRHGLGSFEDLCRGPHVPSTSYVRAFKIMRVAGAYWRGDEKNAMLQRIYGTAWFREKDLKEHLEHLEEAERRDHRKLGKELGLFMMNPVAPASPFFLPKGATLYNLLADHMREQYKKYGYQEVITPQVFNVDLWHRSGHYEHYKDNMYFTNIEDTEYAVKPMNCPGHTLIYANEKRSYRDLPLRVADFGRLHRYERSGVVSGLTRVRTFCQDDAHIFCTPDQVQPEISSLLDMMTSTYARFGFDDFSVFLGTRPESSVGTDELWEQAERGLSQALDHHGVTYRINPGDGAFYGPKIDFVVKDALKREWQLGTIQLDFTLPIRFGLAYTASDNSNPVPVMIHRAVLGSLERFIGILIEHTGGNFPFWLAPVQARVLTINDSHMAYGGQVKEALSAHGWRVETDFSNAKIGAKIRDARLQRIPFRLVVGEREAADKTVAVRERPDEDRGSLTLDQLQELFTHLQKESS